MGAANTRGDPTHLQSWALANTNNGRVGAAGVFGKCWHRVLLSEDGMEFIGLASMRRSAISSGDRALKAFSIVFFAIIKFLFMSHTA